MSGKVCPQCGTEYELDQRFCPKDGSSLKTLGATDLVGETIADRYHVLRKLGEGGMGQVYLAEHVKMQRKSAVKVMNPSMVHDADAISRFNREAANASRINHPNVAAIYDFGETSDGLIYLAMEFIEGEPLTKIIERSGALPPARAASIASQTANALAVAHDMGIVHRDLKPDNIMIAKGRDGADVVKVVDFGIAKATESEKQKVTKTGLVVGTPEYMSPEQLAGDKLDGRSDLYSLALVTFNMLTGKLPFPSETVQESMIMRLTDRPRTLTEITGQAHWPPELQAVLDRALARDLGERYATATDFGRDLVRAVEGMPEGSMAEAGTVVLSAPSVPPTRIAGAAPGAAPKTVAMGAPAPTRAVPAGGAAPAPVRKGRTGLFVGGGVAVAAIAGVLAFTQMKKGDGVTPTTDSSRAAAQDTGAANLSSRLPAPVPTGVDSSAIASTPTTTSTTPKTTTTSGTTTSRPAASAPRVLSGAEARRLLDRWNNEAVESRTASNVIQEVNQNLPRFATLDDSIGGRYMQVQASVTLDRMEAACTIVKQIKDRAVYTIWSEKVAVLVAACP